VPWSLCFWLLSPMDWLNCGGWPRKSYDCGLSHI